jgi:glycerol-3-phosphate dehydrogenase
MHVCCNEMVCTLEDLLERRAGFLYWNSEKRLERVRNGARVFYRGEEKRSRVKQQLRPLHGYLTEVG